MEVVIKAVIKTIKKKKEKMALPHSRRREDPRETRAGHPSIVAVAVYPLLNKIVLALRVYPLLIRQLQDSEVRSMSVKCSGLIPRITNLAHILVR